MWRIATILMSPLALLGCATWKSDVDVRPEARGRVVVEECAEVDRVPIPDSGKGNCEPTAVVNPDGRIGARLPY